MKVFKDTFTKDELMSDSYKPTSPFDDATLDDVAFEVQSARVQKGGEDYGIADNDEEGGGGLGDAVETVIDVVDAFKYTSVPMSKKDFGAYIKGYMVRVKKHLEENKPDRVDPFMKGAQSLVKKILSQYDDFDFYLGESLDAEAYLVPSYYKDGDEAPRFIYLLDGVIEEKY